MAKYTVRYKETVIKPCTVEAASAEEAEAKVYECDPVEEDLLESGVVYVAPQREP